MVEILSSSGTQVAVTKLVTKSFVPGALGRRSCSRPSDQSLRARVLGDTPPETPREAVTHKIRNPSRLRVDVNF